MKLSLLVCTLFTTHSFADAGLTVNNGDSIADEIVLDRITYTGTCPGVEVTKREAKFVSLTTAPERGLRVKVKNVTPGLDDSPYPFTDRKYDKGSASEKTFLFPKDKHKRKTFSVVEGENNFEYIIKKGRTVLEAGRFNANIVLSDKTLERNRQPFQEWVCSPDPWGSNCRWEVYWRCVVEGDFDL